MRRASFVRNIELKFARIWHFSFSSIEQLPNAQASVAFVPDSGTVFREDAKLGCIALLQHAPLRLGHTQLGESIAPLDAHGVSGAVGTADEL